VVALDATSTSSSERSDAYSGLLLSAVTLFGRVAASEQNPAFDVVFYMPLVGTILGRGSNPLAGGAERQVLMLSTRLAERGWRVGLVSNSDARALPPETRGVRLLVHRPFGDTKHLSHRVPRWREIARMLLSLDAEVLVQRAPSSATGHVALAAWLMRRRFVYSSSSVVEFDLARIEPRRAHVALFHLGVRLADSIVVQTPEQVGLCRERFGREPVVIRSLAEEQPLRTWEPKAFLWVGRLAHYKRPEAFLRLARAVPEARFWMVAIATGPAEERRLAELCAAEAELSNFELLAPRPREELGELIARSVAVTSTTQSEGMPNVFLEGWARGVPALTLGHDPDGVVEREAVGAFAGGSAERFAELARQMWAERHDQSELAARCRSYVAREHSIERIVDQWEAVLERRSGAG
jgi:glycosyltransferase involved in cell wall biosynthesis